MADETKEVATPPVNNNEIEQLRESVKKLEAKNFELIGKLQKKDEKVCLLYTSPSPRDS